MKPRLDSSKKYTAIPAELLDQVRQVYGETFSKHTKEGKIIAEGRIYPNEILFRAGFLESGRLRQFNFEVSMEFEPKKDNALKTIHFVVDLAASMMEAYFEAGSMDEFPVVWEEFKAQGKTAFIMASTVNTELEAEADRLLGEEAEDLVVGEDLAEDRKAVVTMLGLGDDDDD